MRFLPRRHVRIHVLGLRATSPARQSGCRRAIFSTHYDGANPCLEISRPARHNRTVGATYQPSPPRPPATSFQTTRNHSPPHALAPPPPARLQSNRFISRRLSHPTKFVPQYYRVETPLESATIKNALRQRTPGECCQHILLPQSRDNQPPTHSPDRRYLDQRPNPLASRQNSPHRRRRISHRGCCSERMKVISNYSPFGRSLAGGQYTIYNEIGNWVLEIMHPISSSSHSCIIPHSVDRRRSHRTGWPDTWSPSFSFAKIRRARKPTVRAK